MKKTLALVLIITILTGGTCAQAGLLDDALDFAENIANEAGKALEKVGDAATDAYQDIADAAGIAWQNTSDAFDNAWNWVTDFTGEKSEAVKKYVSDAVDTLNGYVTDQSEITKEIIRQVFVETLSALNIVSEDALKIWDTIVEYAEAHNINLLTIAKLSIAIIVRILVGGQIGDFAGDYINNVLILWFDALDITSFEKAEIAAADLENQLSAVE